jgi:hypothetical protein
MIRISFLPPTLVAPVSNPLDTCLSSLLAVDDVCLSCPTWHPSVAGLALLRVRSGQPWDPSAVTKANVILIVI